jgi:hypothetical protein
MEPKNMITMCVQCGTGNQLFIYATGYALAKKLGVELQLDTTDFFRAKYRGYTLPLFKGITDAQVSDIKPTIRERSMRYSPVVVSQVQDGDCLQGYWQSEKYFAQYKQELLGILQPKYPLTQRGNEILEEIKHAGDSSVMLHIRRGDYVGHSRGELSLDYYERAIKRICETVKEPTFFVFSDDPGWCRKNLVILHPWILVDPGDKSNIGHIGREDEDLFLMSQCRHAIIANSTFSWWGAWLNPYSGPDRIVVAPQPWFTDPSFDMRDIIPDSWVKVLSLPEKTLVALFSCDKPKYRARAKLCVGAWKNQLPKNFVLEVFTGSKLWVDDCWGSVEKLRAIIRYAVENNFEWLLKVDDDTEIRWSNFIPPTADYAGWACLGTNTDWPYPHCQGGCYWLSRKAMEILAKTPLDNDPLIRNMEDRWVSKTLTNAGINPVDLEEFTMNPAWDAGIDKWKPNAVFNPNWAVLLQSDRVPKITIQEKLRVSDTGGLEEGHIKAFRDGWIVELDEKGQLVRKLKNTRA